jgi:hypothetical protein
MPTQSLTLGFVTWSHCCSLQPVKKVNNGRIRMDLYVVEFSRWNILTRRRQSFRNKSLGTHAGEATAVGAAGAAGAGAFVSAAIGISSGLLYENAKINVGKEGSQIPSFE